MRKFVVILFFYYFSLMEYIYKKILLSPSVDGVNQLEPWVLYFKNLKVLCNISFLTLLGQNSLMISLLSSVGATFQLSGPSALAFLINSCYVDERVNVLFTFHFQHITWCHQCREDGSSAPELVFISSSYDSLERFRSMQNNNGDNSSFSCT